MMLKSLPGSATGRRSALPCPSRSSPAAMRSVTRRFKEGEKTEMDIAAEKDLRERLERAASSGQNKAPTTPEMPTQNVTDFIKTAGAAPIMDAGEPRVNPFIAAFTRRRELFASRAAMVGLFAAGFWELMLPYHPNIMQQVTLGLRLGGWDVGTGTAATLFGLIVLHDAITALAPWSPSFTRANLIDVAKRPAGPPAVWPPLLDFKKWYGFSELGAFSKANEIFNGRLAMLGFAAALLQQLRLGGFEGPGPIAQVAYFMNMPAEQLYAIIPIAFTTWGLFWTGLAFSRGKFGDRTSELEIY